MNTNTSKEKFSNLIYIKPELFDHLIYPLTIKVDDNNIIQLFRKLHIMSTIDYKITLSDWIDQSTKNLNGFTGIYILTNRKGSNNTIRHI